MLSIFSKRSKRPAPGWDEHAVEVALFGQASVDASTAAEARRTAQLQEIADFITQHLDRVAELRARLFTQICQADSALEIMRSQHRDNELAIRAVVEMFKIADLRFGRNNVDAALRLMGHDRFKLETGP